MLVAASPVTTVGPNGQVAVMVVTAPAFTGSAVASERSQSAGIPPVGRLGTSTWEIVSVFVPRQVTLIVK